MNKTIWLFLLCSLILSGCSSKEKVLMAYDISTGSESYSVVEHQNEYEGLSSFSRYKDPEASPVMTIQVNGRQYIGEYYCTTQWAFMQYQSNTYIGDKVTFSINNMTGEMDSFSGPGNSGDLSEDECRVIADTIAGQYIHPELWTMTSENAVEGESYLYSYQYYVDDAKLYGQFNIAINTDGEVFFIHADNIVEAETFLQEYSEEEIELMVRPLIVGEAETLIEEKLAQIYKDEEEYSYEVYDKFIVFLPEGGIGVVWTMGVAIPHKSQANEKGEYGESGERVSILIMQE